MKTTSILLTMLLYLIITAPGPELNLADKKLSEAATSEVKPQLLAVRLYADWCGKCRQLDEKMDSIVPDFDDGRVLFIRLDQTDEFKTAQAGLLSDIIGIGSVFKQYRGKTGLLLIIDATSFELLQEVGHLPETQEIIAILQSHLD